MPYTANDIANVSFIIGQHNCDRLKGSAMKRKPSRRVRIENRVKIPRDWYKFNKCFTLTTDVMFVCGLPIFITLPRKLKLVTAEYMPSRKAGQLAKCLRK